MEELSPRPLHKRVLVHKNGVFQRGAAKEVYLRDLETMPSLLKAVSNRVGFDTRRVFDADGKCCLWQEIAIGSHVPNVP